MIDIARSATRFNAKMPQQIRGLIQDRPNIHNDSPVRVPSSVSRALRNVVPWSTDIALIEATTAPEQWSYALSYPLREEALQGLAPNDAMIIECRVRVHEGDLGIVAIGADYASFASRERTVRANAAPTTVRVWVRDPAKASHLLFRNAASDGTATRFEILNIRAHKMPAGRDFQASWSRPESRSIPIAELGRVLAWAETTWDHPFPTPQLAATSASLEIVDTADLPSVLGITGEAAPLAANGKALADWKMETDDAPILEYLWRAVEPRRHLEFGTWEGFGATLIARVTDAEIWTLNLPEGETGADGETLYSCTDSGQFIGRLYREAGFAPRVHQILCDSREFDTRPFEQQRFDTVLIDGGHTPDVVASDTEKALRVVKKGGTCVWHDFCPDPDTLSRNLAPLGVVQAVVENFDKWSTRFDRLFWIRKSWILVGLGAK